jgi:hypothetical protein
MESLVSCRRIKREWRFSNRRTTFPSMAKSRAGAPLEITPLALDTPAG